MMRKKIFNQFFLFLLVVSIILLIESYCPLTAQGQVSDEAFSDLPVQQFIVGLATLKDNPDYNSARTAFVSVLESKENIEVFFKNLDSNGDEVTYRQGLKDLISKEKVDLVFTVGTRSTLPAVEIIKDIPIVFTAVADPIRSGIVKSLEKNKTNVTGTHCGVPALSQVKIIQRVMPSVKTIGIVYTEGESNAEIQVQDFKEASKLLGLDVITSVVSKKCRTEREVRGATREIIDKVDVLVALQDTSLSRYGKGMIDVAIAHDLPVYTSLGQLLAKGAIFSLGMDFSNIGSLAGEEAYKILKGKVLPGDLPIESDKKYLLVVNLAAANDIGLVIPVQILRTASKIIK